MKTIIFTISLILTGYLSIGQTFDTVSKGKILLGLTFSPDYCYRTINSESSNQWIIDNRDSTEVPKFGYTTGISLIFKPWNRFTFETGFHFSDKGEKTIILELKPAEPDPALPTNRVRFNHHYYYLDIPVKINYCVLKRKVSLFVSAGFSTNLYLYRKTKTCFIDSDETNSTTSNEDLSRLNVAILFGGGIDYNISNKLNCRFEPIYRQSIISIVDAPIKQYQYSIGANFGLFYKL